MTINKNRFINGYEDHWAVLRSFLPVDWQEKAEESGALKRRRKFEGADALHRTLSIHSADGRSLRETVVRAKQGGIASISDVALLKRVRAAGEWLGWMVEQLMGHWAHPRIDGVLGGSDAHPDQCWRHRPGTRKHRNIRLVRVR